MLIKTKHIRRNPVTEKDQSSAEVGRPTFYSKKMKQTAIWLTEEMIDWLKKQPGTMSEVLRTLIEDAMKKHP
jgi:hypothetical protein